MSQAKKLATELAEKRTKFDAIFAKGDAATGDEMKEAETLVSEIGDLNDKYESAVKTEQFAADNRTKLDELKKTPANQIVHSNGDRSQFQGFGGEAGKSFFEDGRLVEEEGW